MKNSLNLIVAGLVATAAVTAQAATATVDGVLNVSDGYGAPVKVYNDNWIDGVSAAGGTNVVSTYFTFDANYVYGAVTLDSGAAAFPGANIYFYSGSANTNTITNTPGTYGNGDDVIAEGANGWGFTLNASPWTTGPTPYNPATVNYVYNGSNTVEFSINRALLGSYDSFRYGGQLFAYEFHTGGDRIDGAIVAVPEPTTLAAIAGASMLGLRRRRA